ncbi:MAG TPA: hypothetical protein VJC39_05125 [Candidatus Nanoarchaeia archaeon]|nr:hypothetical protein [Candidatus Nanoarchaeia archaeon]
MVGVNLLIGIAGMILLVLAFALNIFTRSWNSRTVKYNMFNLIGSGLMMYYAYTLYSWPFMILNLVWFTFALVELGKLEKF